MYEYQEYTPRHVNDCFLSATRVCRLSRQKNKKILFSRNEVSPPLKNRYKDLVVKTWQTDKNTDGQTELLSNL